MSPPQLLEPLAQRGPDRRLRRSTEGFNTADLIQAKATLAALTWDR